MTPELDPRIIDDLKVHYRKAEEKGLLHSREQLQQYYRTFRERFGPEALQKLNDEELLEVMHSHGTRDSLVYWLEFKDDDEFPSPSFGSIAGGSSYKFGIFRRRETGKWISGSPQHEQELTIKQAIEIARRNREQFISGAKLLENLPQNSTDDTYEQLQQDMNRIAPDVCDSAWGHKYFYLLYPEILDNYHNPDYQRFHLTKLLQPCYAFRERYVLAGRYVSIARFLDVPMNNLTTMLNERNGEPYTYWRINIASAKNQQDYWQHMKQEGYITFEWPQAMDLTELKDNATFKEKAIGLLISPHSSLENAGGVKKVLQQIKYFRQTMESNDIVVVANGQNVLAIGKLTDNYTYIPSVPFPHQRPVRWLSFEQWQILDPWQIYDLGQIINQPSNIEEKQAQFSKITQLDTRLAIEKHIFDAPALPPPPSIPQSSIAPPRLQGIPSRIQAILERKGQVILYGPPGTGKTYWAIQTSQELAARSRFHTTMDQLTQEQRTQLLEGNGQQHGNIRICSFHPSYGYEDFLEGFQPESINGQMHFTLRNGIFKTLCEDAAAQPEQNFYLIIDEINRGDIPRIFGELLTVLEKSNRGKKVALPLTGTLFYVPQNVFLIGTMNTADRSIALLDTALRRRFGFIELMPDTAILENTVLKNIPLGPWLKALNERICLHVGRDARNLQIGHAYFLDQGNPVSDFALFVRILQEDILPLLEEYCYEDYSILEKILGTGLIDGQKQQVRTELFEPVNHDHLITTLLAQTPELTTSSQVRIAEVQNDAEDEE